MGNKLDFNGIISKDIKDKAEKKKKHEEITSRQYFEKVAEDPLIAQTSISRIRELVRNAGIEEMPLGERWFFGPNIDKRYPFFSEDLYGIDDPIYKTVNFIEVGAGRGSTGKQILVLVGPPASGKSTMVRKLMEGLERYDKRRVYAVKGCPKFEDPLHLLPRHLREEARKKPNECPEYPECRGKHLHLGVRIDGDLCPVCRDLLLTKYTDQETDIVKWWEVPVENFTFSIQGRRGVGSFEPTGEKAADVNALTGRENINITSTKGHDHPRSYELTGEIPKAERGLVEGREILACDPDVLNVFFSVGEERQLKIQGSPFPHISVDTLVIGHTNNTVFNQFRSNKEYEGLHDRFLIIPFPYPLRVKDEVAIYKKLIERDSDFVRLKKCHIAPGTLELSALFAVMTRYISSQMGIDSLTKAKIYNGDIALTEIENKEKNPIDNSQLVEEGHSNPDITKREGMFGVSSRTVLAALNSALVKEAEKDGCLSPLKAIRALHGIFDQRMGFAPEDIERYRNFLSASEKGESVTSEYRQFVIKTVTKAFIRGYRDLAEENFWRYIEQVKLYRNQERKHVRGQIFEIERDEMSGKPKEADIKFMRSIETQKPLGWTEEVAEVARGELLELIANNLKFGYDTYRPLREASENKLVKDSEKMLSLILATDKPKGEEEGKRRKDLFNALLEEGHCVKCAREHVEKARDFISE